MKKNIYKIVGLLMVIQGLFFLNSCTEPVDYFTGEDMNYGTGGLIESLTANVPYKVGLTTNIDLNIDVLAGPQISKVEVYCQFTSKANGQSTNELIGTIDVGGANANAVVSKSISVDYAKLTTGLVLNGASIPVETALAIGDYFTVTYVSIMDDGRSVVNNDKSNIAIANKYAGPYHCVGTFDHPTAGVRDVDEEKYLTPIDITTCWGDAGDLGYAGYTVTLSVETTTVVVGGKTMFTVNCGTPPGGAAEMANYPGEENYYDPATGEYHVSYFYVGGTGNRIMREVWTPIVD